MARWGTPKRMKAKGMKWQKCYRNIKREADEFSVPKSIVHESGGKTQVQEDEGI